MPYTTKVYQEYSFRNMQNNQVKDVTEIQNKFSINYFVIRLSFTVIILKNLKDNLFKIMKQKLWKRRLIVQKMILIF